MKWNHLLALGSACLFSTASAVSSSESFKVAKQELNYIEFLSKNLTKAIKSWDGVDYGQALFNIHNPANETCYYVFNATDTLKKYKTTYDVTHSFEVGTPAQMASYAVNESIATLNSRYASFKKRQLLDILTTDVNCLLNATRDFSDLLVSYIQPDLQPVGVSLARQFVASLQMGLDCAATGSKADCNTNIVDGQARYQMAIDTTAMHKDGSPIA